MKTEWDKFIKLKKEIYNLTDDKAWQNKHFLGDLKQFHLKAIAEERNKVLESVKEMRPAGDSSTHQSYNDGQRDLADRIINKLK